MAPSGVPILRPPANALPLGIEWQATQSAARAKYSPSPSGGLTGSAARDVPPAQSKTSAQKPTLETIVTSLKLSRSAEIGIHDRQRANALAGCGEDRIRHGRGDGRDTRLASAAPDISTARY